MPGSECSKLRKAMDTRLKSGRGRALEKQKMGQGGGFTEMSSSREFLLQGISAFMMLGFHITRYNYESCNV